MTNILSTVITTLLALCEKAANGVAEFGAAIGLVQNTEQKIRNDAAALVLARDNYEQAKALLMARRQAVRSATETARQFLTLARDILKPHLGSSYSETWDVTGLVGSLVIPRNTDRVQTLLQSMKAFFVANGPWENAGLEITAVRCGVLFDELVAAQNAVSTQETVVKDLMKVRDDKTTVVRKRLRGLIAELTQLISPLDARWAAFGLNMPGAQATPDVPRNVTAVLIGSNAVAVQWNAAPRAEQYRVWKKVDGVDAEFVAAGSPADLDFTIEGLPGNTTVQIAVSAVNSGGESNRSEIIAVTTH